MLISELIDNIVDFYRNQGPIMLLESQCDIHPASQDIYIAALPERIIKGYGENIIDSKDGLSREFEQNPWDFLQQFWDQNSEWLFGYLGYDLKNHLEKLHSDNKDNIHAPDFYFMVPGVLIKINRHSRKVEVIKGELPARSAMNYPSELGITVSQLASTVSREEYIRLIAEIQQQITEGHFYEINLSRQLSGSYKGDSYELYRNMRQVAPVPFGAYLSFEDLSVCSQSPERFLRREGPRIFSQPIKGTIRRGKNNQEDEMLLKKLSNSAKDRSENLMIVDLVRNDLSRIALSETVKVPNLFEIQTFGTVHQMVSTVEAQTELNNPFKIIKACYPMGSMTGAPKISAMNTIEELENYKRGIYSGSIGYIKPNGDFDFNVVIRTAIMKNNQLYYPVGGAVTADSVPAEEWEETKVKAKALTALFNPAKSNVYP